MKKLLMLFSMVLIGITLTGCSLLPEDIETISEEFCRDNPTNEICEGDLVENLDNQVILDVFNIIVSEYSDDTNTAFCDDYFSVTNIELLDACRLSREDLVPLDFEDYTVVGAEKKTTLSTQNIYEVKTVSPDGFTEVVFTIGVVNVESVMYVSTWDYEIITVDPTLIDVPLTEAQAYFEQFILDYFDEAIETSVFCEMYFPEDEYCAEDRAEIYTEEFTITFDSIEDLGDGTYKIQLTFDDSSEMPMIEFVDVTFSYDEAGNIVMTFGEEDYVNPPLIDFNEAELFLNNLVDDFNNSVLADEQVCAVYFQDEEVFECSQHRAYTVNDGLTIQLTDFFVDDYNNYVLILSYMDGSTLEYEEIIDVFFFYNDFNKLKVSFNNKDSNDHYIDELLAEDTFVQFIEDFGNSSITNEDFCEMYFPGIDNPNCIFDRANLNLDEVYVYLNWFDHYEGYFTAEISIEEPSTGNIYVYTVGVGFYYNEFDNIQMDIWETHFIFNYLFFEDAVPVVEQFFIDIVDPSVSWEYINELYFDNTANDGGEERDIDLAAGFTVTFIEAIQQDVYPDSFFIVVIEIFDEGVYTTEELWMRVGILDNGKYFIEVDDKGEYVDNSFETALNTLQIFVDLYQNEANSSEYVCGLYFENEQLDNCIEIRDNVLFDNLTLHLIDIRPEGYLFIVDFAYEDVDGTYEYFTIPVDIYYNEYAELLMNFHYFDGVIIPIEEARTTLEDFYSDTFDETITNEQFCDLYDMYFHDCIYERASILEVGGLIYVVDFWWSYDNVFGVLIGGDDIFADGYDEIEVYFQFYYDTNGTVRFTYIFNEGPYPNEYLANYAVAEEFYVAYLNDYFFDGLTNQELADLYFMGELYPEFEIRRNLDLSTVDYFVYEGVTDPDGGDGMFFFEARYTITRTDSTVETIVEYFRVFVYEDGNFYIEIVEHPYGLEIIGLDLIEMIMVDYYTDFNDYFDSSENFCSMYHEEPSLNECITFRDEMISENYTLDFGSVDKSSTGGYVVEIEVSLDGVYSHTLFVEMYPYIMDTDIDRIMFDMYYLDVVIDVFFNDLPILLDTFAVDFANDGIFSSDFCGIYTDNLDPCIDLRDGLLASGMNTAAMVDFFFSNDYDHGIQYFVVFEFAFNDGSFESLTFEVFPYISDVDGILVFDLYSILDPNPTFDELVSIFGEYIGNYSVGTILSSDFCYSYSDFPTECEAMREDLLDRGLYNVDLVEMYFVGNPDYQPGYFVVLEFAFSDGTFETNLYEVIPYYSEIDGALLFDLVLTDIDGTVTPILGVLADPTITEYIMNGFYIDFANSTYTNDEICSMYFDGEYNEMNCGADRLDFLADNLVTTVLSFMTYTDSSGNISYVMEIEFASDSNTFVSVEYMRVWELDNGNTYIEFLMDVAGPIDPAPVYDIVPIEEVQSLFATFVLDYNDLFNTDTYICDTYAHLLDVELYCFEGRTSGLQSGTYLVIDSINLLSDTLYGTYYQVVITETDGTDSYVMSNSYYIYYDADGLVVIEYTFTEIPEY